VITMGARGGPPEEIGHKVAAALVGTLLGILLCYGLVGPLAQRMGKIADEEHAYLLVLRVTMIAFLKGIAPIMAVEMGRRTVPGRCASLVQGSGRSLPRGERVAGAPGSGSSDCGINQHGDATHHHHQEEGQPSTATTAAHGKSPTPTS
jgi:hypothetical protein